MVDGMFEDHLDRMFAEVTPMADCELFAARVLARLDRGWNFRQLFIGGLGVAGGLIGGAQIVGSGLAGRLVSAGSQSSHVLSTGLKGLDAVSITPDFFPVDTEVLWMSAALGLLAVGFVLARAIRNL